MPYLNIARAMVFGYGLGDMMSFSGIFTWTNYDGDIALGPYMALWDLALAIALMKDIEL